MGQLGPNLGPKIVPKRIPRLLPRVTFSGTLKTSYFYDCVAVLIYFLCPEGSWESHFRLKLGVWTQHAIKVGLQASCEPPWWWKCEKWGPNFGPNMGGTNWVFRPWNPLGSILGPTCPPSGPKTLQEAILGPSWDDFGAILVPFWAQAGWKNVPTWLQNSLVESSKPMSKPTARWRLVGAAGG